MSACMGIVMGDCLYAYESHVLDSGAIPQVILEQLHTTHTIPTCLGRAERTLSLQFCTHVVVVGDGKAMS